LKADVKAFDSPDRSRLELLILALASASSHLCHASTGFSHQFEVSLHVTSHV